MKVHPSRAAISAATVLFPDPETPITMSTCASGVAEPVSCTAAPLDIIWTPWRPRDAADHE
jgi:hypothetical protein